MGTRRIEGFGAVCAILLGLTHFATGTTYMRLPPDQQAGGADPGRFLASVATEPASITLLWVLLAGTGFLGFGVVSAMQQRVQHVHEGLARWATALGYLAFAVTTVHFVRFVVLVPEHAQAYAAAEGAAQSAFARAFALAGLTGGELLTFGVTGIWALTIATLAIRGGALPRALGFVGLAVGVLYLVGASGYALRIPLMVSIGAGLGGVVMAPIWYIGVGLVLRRASPPEPDLARGVVRAGTAGSTG